MQMCKREEQLKTVKRYPEPGERVGSAPFLDSAFINAHDNGTVVRVDRSDGTAKVLWDNPKDLDQALTGGWWIDVLDIHPVWPVDSGVVEGGSLAANGIGPGAGKGARAAATDRELARVKPKTKRRSHLKLKVGDSVALADGTVGEVTSIDADDFILPNLVSTKDGDVSEWYTPRGRFHTPGNPDRDIASVNGVPLVN
jgi:hypothetical protein